MILSRGALDPQLLADAGVTRIREGHIPLSSLKDGRAAEVIVTASTSFVASITSVDAEPVGDLRPLQLLSPDCRHSDWGRLQVFLRPARRDDDFFELIGLSLLRAGLRHDRSGQGGTGQQPDGSASAYQTRQTSAV
jgi:hypothetical protein